MALAFYLQWQSQYQDKKKFRLRLLCVLFTFFFYFLRIMMFDIVKKPFWLEGD